MSDEMAACAFAAAWRPAARWLSHSLQHGGL